jgi:hypothetical protein
MTGQSPQLHSIGVKPSEALKKHFNFQLDQNIRLRRTVSLTSSKSASGFETRTQCTVHVLDTFLYSYKSKMPGFKPYFLRKFREQEVAYIDTNLSLNECFSLDQRVVVCLQVQIHIATSE